MDFGLSEDQVLFEETLRGFLAEQVPIDRVRALRDESCPDHRGIWSALAELGIAGILVPEAQGGSGLGLLDAAIVSQALGAAATPTPFLGSSVISVTALREIGGAEAESRLAGIATGDLVMGVAATELFSVREGAGVSVSKGKLSGKSMMAIDACAADQVLVVVGSDCLAIVDRDADGVEVNRLVTTDNTRCTSEILLDAVLPRVVFEGCSDAIARMLDAGRIVLAADTLGACESMVNQAIRYSLQRKQFERLIGSFQAVKHMCAEMIAEVEPARSLIWYAGHSFDVSPEEAPLLACHSLAHLSEIGQEIASVATQVHGGIGWTDEQNLHFWYKRIGLNRHLLGGPDILRERAAQLQGFDSFEIAS